MKKLIIALALAAVGVAFAAEEKDPAAPFTDYGAAMVSTAEKPLVADWQGRQKAALAAATTEAAIKAFVADEASAKALLAKLRGAYKTDPVVATQVAAVSQYVMGKGRCDARKTWVKALLGAAEANADAYVRQQCVEQLRWCGCKCPGVLARLRALAKGDKDRGVRDLAALAIAGIEASEK